MKTYMCMMCGFIYNEEIGCPEEGIPPKTRWQDIPDDWQCPDCGSKKINFQMQEI